MLTKRLLWIVLVTAVFALAACRGDVSIQTNTSGGVDVTVTNSEADINAVIADALAASGNPLLRNPSVDLQNGQIVISGEHDRRDGGGTVAGTITLTAAVVDGRLDINVTAINIEGFDASDERLEELNQNIEARLQDRARREDNNRVRLTSVTITDDSLSFTIGIEGRP